MWCAFLTCDWLYQIQSMNTSFSFDRLLFQIISESIYDVWFPIWATKHTNIHTCACTGNICFLYFHFLLAHLVSFFVSQTHIYKITRCGERYILACEWIYTNLDVHFFLACIVYSIWLFILIEYKFIIPFMFIFVGTIYSIYQIYLIVRASMLWSFAFQKYFIY